MRISEYLGVHNRTRQESLSPDAYWFRWRRLVWSSALVCDWGIVCQESLFVLARVCKWVCLCVGARRSLSVVCKHDPLCTPSHFTPAIINHNSNWLPLILDPNPGNLSSNFCSPSNPSLSHSVTYWAGLKLPPLSLSYTIITRLTTWNMNTPTSPWQPPKPHVISLDLGDTATSHYTQRLGSSVRWGGYCNRYFNMLCCESDL